MIDTVFYLIVTMSVAACFVIVVLLIIRQIRPLPRRVIYPLWGLAFFRLIMPFTLQTNLSLFNYTGGLVKRLITVETFTQKIAPDAIQDTIQNTIQNSIQNASPGFRPDLFNNFSQEIYPIPSPPLDSLRLSTMNSFGAVERYAPIEYRTETLRQVFTTGAVIWAIIAAAALIAAVFLYSLTQKELKNAIHIKDNLYRSDMLLSPVITGLIKPRIILPASLDPDSVEGRIILAHENTHKKRLDNLWRLLGICITCLHWFNPFAWVMLKMFFTDMELSCDEKVIRKMGVEERKTYAGTLLRFAEDQRMLVSTAFGQSGVKVRIVNVLNYKKLTVIGVVVSSIFLLILAVALVTNPQLRR